MAVPTRTRCARAANHASAAIASGDGLGDATCPPTHSDSIGNDSRYSTSLVAPLDITPNDRRPDVGTMRRTLSLRLDAASEVRDPNERRCTPRLLAVRRRARREVRS